jgi:hypothetical protein
MTTPTSTTTPELVYAQAIPILASGLYPEKVQIIREYVQNASDAIDAFRQIAEHIEETTDPLIKIMIQGRSLIIWDNGIGMDGEEVEKLKRIAYSEKREGQEAGHKGIGRLAGIAVARKLVVSTTSYGDPTLHRFEFRARDLMNDIDEKKRGGIQEAASEVINRYTKIETLEVDRKDHYTMVELRDIDDHPELLDPVRLKQYIGEMAPVGFSPTFEHGKQIARELATHVPDYSPKAIWITTETGSRSQIYKPYTEEMGIADPDFIQIIDLQDSQKVLGFCWCASKGQSMLGRIRPSGKKFTVDGESVEARERLAGVCYKLFGISVGGRTLPLTTLWEKDYTRALWFTGEVHIVDKNIKPTTDRSDFIESEARNRFYAAARVQVGQRLKTRAQQISNDRLAHEEAEKWRERYETFEKEIGNGGIQRSGFKRVKTELNQSLEKDLSRSCDDPDIRAHVALVKEQGRQLRQRLDEARSKKDIGGEIADLAKELDLPTHSRKVYAIIMETIDTYFEQDRDTFYELSGRIHQTLKRKL